MPYSIPAGAPTTLVAGQTYALPARACFLAAPGAVEVSFDGTTWAALAGATPGGVMTGAAFVRSTAGGVVSAKIG
jgi:hypothetical protein